MNMRFGTNKDLNKEPLRLSVGSTPKKEGPKTGFMKPEEHGYGRSRTKRGTSSDAFDDLKKASQDYKVGASGEGSREKSTEMSSEGQSLIWALVVGLVGMISLELVYKSKGASRGGLMRTLGRNK